MDYLFLFQLFGADIAFALSTVSLGGINIQLNNWMTNILLHELLFIIILLSYCIYFFLDCMNNFH